MIPYINQSLLNMAAKCMKMVDYRHLQGIKIPPAAAAHRGTAVHEAAERDAYLIMETQARLSVDELQDIAANAFHESIEKNGVYFSNEEAPNSKQVLSHAKDEAVKAAALYGECVSPRIGKPIEIEKELVVEVDGLSYPLGGTLDLVHMIGDEAFIGDLKTTGKKPDLNIATHSIQAPLYGLLAEHALGLQNYEFEYDFLVVQKTKRENVRVRAIITPEHQQGVIERAKVFENYLKTGSFMPAAPGSWWCSESWCGYYGLCPYGKRQAKQIVVGA